MRDLAVGLMVLGVVLIVVGGGLWLAGRLGLPLGRLPGDIHLEGRRWSVSIPIVTMLLVSLILTILLNLFLRK